MESPPERDLYGPFLLHDDYLFAFDLQGLRQPTFLYVDLRDTLCMGQHNWKKIDWHYLKGSIAITPTFSIEEDDLAISVLR
jgi:hypothetical protein